MSDIQSIKKQIKENETLLLSLGMGGLAYTSHWNKVANETCELEKKLKVMKNDNMGR